MMNHTLVSQLLGMLIVILATAKVGGALARRLGQPAVLGELVGGIVAGPSVLGWVDPAHQALQFLAELGVMILLFAIGLETDVNRLLRVGVTSITVAVAGVFLPFFLGYAACLALGLSSLRAVMAAATLTAAGVTATPAHAEHRPPPSSYTQHNLVSDLPGTADLTDASLVNPWGLAQGPTTPAWAADNGTNVATLYQGDGVVGPLQKVPLTVAIPGDGPTGQVFNSTTTYKFTTAGAGFRHNF